MPCCKSWGVVLTISGDFNGLSSEALQEARLHSSPKVVDDRVDKYRLYVVHAGPGADGDVHLLEELKNLGKKNSSCNKISLIRRSTIDN
jgi:hypothetical protein